MTTTFFLITPTSLLSSFINAADRRYFSNPILVEPLYSEISTKLLFVRDPNRGHTYPTNPKFVVASWRLSRRQRRMAGVGR